MNRDERYVSILLKPLETCLDYKPKFGQGNKCGLTLSDFRQLYHEDIFYSWLGLDSPLLYTAHRVAGGMTSLYRQIGLGCESLFRTILCDEYLFQESDAKWSYKIVQSNGKIGTLSLDGRIIIDKIQNKDKKELIVDWLIRIGKELSIERKVLSALQGVVFEVRQGYKSKDSKRQNADINNATNAYAHGYLPCVLMMSNQIDTDLITRYKNAKWAILEGKMIPSPYSSSYSFMKEIVGYNLEQFFVRNSNLLKEKVHEVVAQLLSVEKI